VCASEAQWAENNTTAGPDLHLCLGGAANDRRWLYLSNRLDVYGSGLERWRRFLAGSYPWLQAAPGLFFDLLPPRSGIARRAGCKLARRSPTFLVLLISPDLAPGSAPYGLVCLHDYCKKPAAALQ